MGILIPLPAFPDVPIALGVPQLRRAIGTASTVEADVALVVADVAGLSAIAPPWGIFDSSGNNVLNPDSIIAFEYRQEWKLANYPLEGGAFASYDKVQTPYETRIQMAKGGSDAVRQSFLTTMQAVAASLSLYTVVTSDATYPNVNIGNWGYRKTSRNGVSLLTIDIFLQQINVAGIATVTQTAAPDGAAQTNGGIVQGATPTAAQSSAISEAGAPLPVSLG